MEHRTDLEQALLAGLPEQERLDTEESMARATAARLEHLRSIPEQETEA